MKISARLLLAASALSLTAACAATPTETASTPAPVMAEAPKPAPLSQLVSEVDIPYQTFTLDNGLRVVVHEDHTSPLVAFSVWYGVGSRNEPKGKTGFAHLFEHIMFYGSENAPGGIFPFLDEAGVTDMNGTTSFDRTNYFETVPTGALDRVLMLESDRMGYLLGAVTEEKLKTQVGVVQNERRQSYENRPFGMTWFEIYETLYPEGHPYHHLPIGSMEDIGSATMADVQGWFKDHYGPNNAVIALAGDIDLPTAKAKMNEWFGAIPAGPKVPDVVSPVPTLPAAVDKTMTDKIPTTRVAKYWATPVRGDSDSLALELAGMVLAGLESSRMDEVLVRQKKLAVSVSGSADAMLGAGNMDLTVDVAPGADPAEARAAMEALLADFLANGPTEDELVRAKTAIAAGEIRGLDRLGGGSGVAPTLASSWLFDGSPDAFKTRLAAMTEMTPEHVRAVTQKWLSRPAFTLTVEPESTEGANAGDAPTLAAKPDMSPADAAVAHFTDEASITETTAVQAAATQADRSTVPAIGESGTVDFPEIQRATLSNGMEVYFAQSDSVPTVTMQMIFEGGWSADPVGQYGKQGLMLSLMDQGTADLDTNAFASTQEELGASLSSGMGWDETIFSMSALTPNLEASLDLFADYVRDPGFRADDFDRVKVQQLNAIETEMNDPGSLARRALYTQLYGENHPYAVPSSGTGTTADVRTLTLDEVKAAHSRWLRPDSAQIFAVGDTTLPELTASLEAAFGNWKANKMAPPVRDVDKPIPAEATRVVLIDRPGSAQSMIRGGRVLDMKGNDPRLVDLQIVKDIFAAGITGRQDKNLRDDKGWSYGGGALITQPEGRSAFIDAIGVQTDRTGDSLLEIRKMLKGITSDEPITAKELNATIAQQSLSLPGQFETNGGVLAGMVDIVRHDKADDYYETLPAHYNAVTAATLEPLAKSALDPEGMVFVIVGDVSKVGPQLDEAGIEYTVGTVE